MSKFVNLDAVRDPSNARFPLELVTNGGAPLINKDVQVTSFKIELPPTVTVPVISKSEKDPNEPGVFPITGAPGPIREPPI